MTNIRPTLIAGEIYHVYNRSVAKESLFETEWSIDRFLDTVAYYRAYRSVRFSFYNRKVNKTFPSTDKLKVEIFAFAIMPNHYHFLLQQLNDGGISRFISEVQNSYAKSYNLICERHGSVFQNNFKAKHIDTEAQFNHTSRYIHLNPVRADMMTYRELERSRLTSYYWYLNPAKNMFISSDRINGYFKKIERYRDYVRSGIRTP